MAALPDSVDAVELAWTILSAIAAASSLLVWRWARWDLRYVRAHDRRHLVRSFREDVRNARWRLGASIGLVTAGVVAMTQPMATPHRTPAGWVIIALLMGSPLQIILRNLSEAKTRRTIVSDVEVEDNGRRNRRKGDSR